jgi:hypothetical protein
MYVNTNVDGFFIIDSTIEGPVGTTGRYGMIGSGYRVAVVGSEFNNITYTISRCYGSKILWADNRLVKAQGSLNPGFRLLSGKYYYFKGNYILASQAYPIGSARSADQTPTESTEKFLIENNYLTMWTPGGTGFFSDLMVRDLVFRNNVVAGIVDGIRIQNPANGQFPAPPGTVMDGVRIYGNTFFNNFIYFNGVIADGANVVVKNNLISYEGIPAITDPNGDSPRGIISVGDVSHNIVYMRNYPLRCMNAAGQSGSTVCQDPQFASTDPLALNFLHLNSNSPAIDVGTPVIGMYRDYDGTPRPQGAEYDIGAYEYSTGGPVQNHAPIVNAGPDQVISLPSLAQLAGTAVDDNLPAHPQLTVGWSIVSGPGPVVLGNASSLNTTASFSDSGVYVLRLTASDGVLSRSDNVQILVNEESEEPSQSSAPSENKFNACQDLNQSREAKLCFDVAENGFVEVKIYSRDGRLAKKLVSEEKSAGRYTVVWDGKNESGEKVSSGVYRATLTVNGGDIQKIKVIVIN